MSPPATVVGQWEMAADMIDSGSSSPVNGTVEGAVAFGQPTIAADGGGGLALNGAGSAKIPTAAPVFQQQAFGISIYTQISALAGTQSSSQIVNRDTGLPPNGVAIEYLQVDGINRLDPYMRTDAGGPGSAKRMARVGGIADLPLNTGLLVTFTYDPATTPKCKVYLRQDGDSSNRLVGSGLLDESEVTQGWTQNDFPSPLLVGIYPGGGGPSCGAFQRLMFWAGAPSREQLDALPAPRSITVMLPAADPLVAGDVTGKNIPATGTSISLNPTVPGISTNAAAATVSIDGVSGPVTAKVSTADKQTITITRATGSGSYTVTYKLTNADGQNDNGTIQGTVSTASNVVQIPSGCTFVGKVAKTINDRDKPAYDISAGNPAAFVDSNFPGIRIIRIAGDFDKPVPNVDGDWPVRAKQQYASTPPWNDDEDLLCMNNVPLGTGRVLYINGMPPYQPRFARNVDVDPKLLRWRPGHPNQQIYVNGNAIRSYDPYSHTHALVKKFTGYADLSFGIFPVSGMNGQLSYDGNRMVVSGRRTSDDRIVAFMYDFTAPTEKGPDIEIYFSYGGQTATNLVVHPVQPGANPDHDFITIDASGRYVMWSFQGGNDVAIFDAEAGGAPIVNTAAAGTRHSLFNRPKHPETTISGNGLTAYLTFADIGADSRLARVTLPNLDNLQHFTAASDQNVSHASGGRQWKQRSDGKRWCSTFGTGNDIPGNSNQPLYGAVFRYNIDDPANGIQVLAHHRTRDMASPENNSVRGHECWHALSPSGTRSIFTSTWHGPVVDGTQAADQWYVVEHCEFLNR